MLKFKINIFILILFVNANVCPSTLQIAAIDIANHSNESRSYAFEKKNIPTKIRIPAKNENENKITQPENNFKNIEGYRTIVDKKGNVTREYVHGEVEKGKKNIYTGYLYGKDNKKTFTYGTPSSGVMSTNGEYGADVTIESESKPDGHY